MSIFFATPMYGGQCTAGFHKSAMATCRELTNANVPFAWSTPYNESLITRARNKLVAEFLKTDLQVLMFIDADIEFSPEDVAKLWNLDAPVSCAAYPMKRKDAPLSCWKDGRLVEVGLYQEPVPVDYAGTGFLMIQREVFETLDPEVYDEDCGEIGAYFLDPIKGGVHLSEDYYFCERWREAGGEILMEPSIRLKHWGTYRFGE